VTESPNPMLSVTETLTGQVRPVRRVALGLGGNVGDVLETLQQAIDALLDTPETVAVRISSVWQCPAIGGPPGQPDHLNAVLVLESSLPARLLLERAHVVEAALGRDRSREEHWGPRTIDIDLLAVGDRKLTEADLELPHPLAHERAFVLLPWAEADPDAVLPGHGRVADLAAAIDPAGATVREDLRLWLPG
jgi:2-amino-4-hydroxy-6-hydroxymethyldihydropteridine diphosphokinase